MVEEEEVEEEEAAEEAAEAAGTSTEQETKAAAGATAETPIDLDSTQETAACNSARTAPVPVDETPKDEAASPPRVEGEAAPAAAHADDYDWTPLHIVANGRDPFQARATIIQENRTVQQTSMLAATGNEEHLPSDEDHLLLRLSDAGSGPAAAPRRRGAFWWWRSTSRPFLNLKPAKICDMKNFS